MIFPENLSAVAKADAVLLEALVQRPSKLFSHLENCDRRVGTLVAAEHKDKEHLRVSFCTKSPYRGFKTGGVWNDSP